MKKMCNKKDNIKLIEKVIENVQKVIVIKEQNWRDKKINREADNVISSILDNLYNIKPLIPRKAENFLMEEVKRYCIEKPKIPLKKFSAQLYENYGNFVLEDMEEVEEW